MNSVETQHFRYQRAKLRPIRHKRYDVRWSCRFNDFIQEEPDVVLPLGQEHHEARRIRILVETAPEHGIDKKRRQIPQRRRPYAVTAHDDRL